MRNKGASWETEVLREKLADVERSGKSVTKAAEARANAGKGLDRLVDPKEYNGIRMANSLLIPKGDQFVLEYGVAMPVKTDLDTTGSMGGNVDLAFKALPDVQALLVKGESAVLKRYHVQIATGVIQDWEDRFPYQVSQFEPDEEVFNQMGMLVPEKQGGDTPEEYQLGLFATGFLTKTTIVKYDLKGYYFVVGDVMGRDELDNELLKRVFGPSVMENAFGKKSRVKDLPSTKEVAEKVLENWHVFYLNVGGESSGCAWWKKILGKDRVVILPRTQHVAKVQACIIGLTEGTLDRQNAIDFLGETKTNKGEATNIIEAVAGIPEGLQRGYDNFDRIPLKGAVFASRDDIWPIGTEKKGKPDKKWKL